MRNATVIAKVSEKSGLTLPQAEAAIDALAETIYETLRADGKVQLTGFGTFEIRRREARVGHRPGTSEPMAIPAKRIAIFRPGKNLKEKI